MRGNLQELAKVMRPISDERARELRMQAEAEGGDCSPGFVAAEHEATDEFWARAEAMDPSLAPRKAYA